MISFERKHFKSTPVLSMGIPFNVWMNTDQPLPRSLGNQPFLFSIALGLITLCIWGLLYRVQFLEYDENYAVMGQAFLISFATLIWIFIIAWRNYHFIRKCWWQTLAFLILASPFTVILIGTNYREVFGAGIQL